MTEDMPKDIDKVNRDIDINEDIDIDVDIDIDTNEELHLKMLKTKDFILDGNWLIFNQNLSSTRFVEMFEKLGVQTNLGGDIKGDIRGNRKLENGMLYYSDRLYYVYLDEKHIKRAKSILPQKEVKVIVNCKFEKYKSQEEAILNKKFDGQICNVGGRGAILVDKRVVYIGELDVLTNLDMHNTLEIRYNNGGKIDWILKHNEISEDINEDIDEDIVINIDTDIDTEDIDINNLKLPPEAPRYYSLEEANTYLDSHKIGDVVAILKDNKWVNCKVQETVWGERSYSHIGKPYSTYVQFYKDYKW